MKSIAIVGSPNPKGSCSHLVEQMNQGTKPQGIDAAAFYLHGMNIR